MKSTKARSCDGKLRHATREEALAHLWRRVRLGASAKCLSVYRCKHCAGFHLGHHVPGRRSR